MNRPWTTVRVDLRRAAGCIYLLLFTPFPQIKRKLGEPAGLCQTKQVAALPTDLLTVKRVSATFILQAHLQPSPAHQHTTLDLPLNTPHLQTSAVFVRKDDIVQTVMVP